jgi:tetratricopeptide (TPR) repeat protein
LSQRLGRDVQMANIAKSVVLAVIASVLVGGCQKADEQKVSEVGIGDIRRKKTELLNQIEAKYENPDAHYELGRLYQADSLWDKAEWHYNVALGFDPVHRQSQAAIVKLLAESGDSARSELSAEIYMNQASTSAQASLRLGQAFQKEALDDYAVACYQQALALAPNSAAIHRQIGYYYLSKGDKVRAEESLKRSFQIDPYQAEVAGVLGRMGVIVQVPRKTEKNTTALDKILNR